MQGGRTGALVLVALLVAAGCAGGVGPADVGAAGADAGPAADPGDGPPEARQAPNATANPTTVRVSAVGTVEADPDQAVLRVAVTATATNATAVRDRLAANASSMRSALADAGVANDQVRTVAFDIRQERPDRDQPGEVRFRGIHAFEITVTNVSRTGVVLDAAVTGGANEVDRVAFTLSEETRREVRSEALGEAMADARADAETVARAEGLVLVGVRSIATGEADVGPARFRAATPSADGTEVSPGPVTVTARVEVTYNATGTGR